MSIPNYIQYNAFFTLFRRKLNIKVESYLVSLGNYLLKSIKKELFIEKYFKRTIFRILFKNNYF